MGEWGVGMPAARKLEWFGRVVYEAFGATPYLVGSALKTTDWRDVDVRVILTDEEFERQIGGAYQAPVSEQAVERPVCGLCLVGPGDDGPAD